MDIVVPGRGPIKAKVMLVGEAPGEEEAESGRPFVGRAGREQDAYLRAAGLHRSQIYMTNLVKTYVSGSPDPTPAMIEHWTGRLIQEVATIQPRFIITVGRFATRFFLGPDADMDFVHGIPHAVRADLGLGGTVLPCYHPAFGFYDDDTRPLIQFDYLRAGAAISGKLALTPPFDAYPDPVYIDIDMPFDGWDFDVAAMDTEGIPGAEWSLQVCTEPGTGLVFRKSSPYFTRNMASLQRYIDGRDPTIVVHNGMYDIEMSRLMGLDLFDARLFDTMYAAYLLRVEPQGLKPLAYRWAGMRMASYVDTVGQVGLEKQLDYLGRVLETAWPRPEPRVELGNDGTARLYTPQPVWQRVESILNDYYSGLKVVDPFKRWKAVDREVRRPVEAALGPMPIGTLDDIPLDQAIYYAGRDPDATLRAYYRLVPALKAQGLTDLMADGMAVLPVFEEMQASGMRANRIYFETLRDRMEAVMSGLQSRISAKYNGGRPFNPNATAQVATLMRRRGLRGEKRTGKGAMSTSKKSIEHLRYSDPAIADVIDWREHAKIRDSFCNPVIEILDDRPTARIRTTIKTTRVASRRISASDPNLTAIPVRNELGLAVRDGFVAEEGCSLGSWDLSQIEMRYMAHVSRDPLLVKFFTEKNPITGKDSDVHAETAARIFGINIQDVKEMEHRYPAKRAGFGIITNIQGPGLLDQLRMFGCTGWDEKSCDNLIREWLKVYRGVADFLGACRNEVRQNGMVRDVWGHIRYLPGVWSEDSRVKAEAERAASSHKIQGGAQGMIQRSMAWVKPYVRGLASAGATCRWILQIHDELILEFQDDLWETMDPLIREGLIEHSMKLIVPVKCSGNRAKSWGKLK